MASGVGIHGVPQFWGRPSQTVIGRVAFAFWFLSPSVELVQAVRERACGLGVRLNHGGERPLTRRSTGRQKRTAFGSLRCAPAPVTSALVAVASVLLGCGVPVALVPCLVAKPAYSGEHQGRPNPRSVWLHQ